MMRIVMLVTMSCSMNMQVVVELVSIHPMFLTAQSYARLHHHGKRNVTVAAMSVQILHDHPLAASIQRLLMKDNHP